MKRTLKVLSSSSSSSSCRVLPKDGLGLKQFLAATSNPTSAPITSSSSEMSAPYMPSSTTLESKTFTIETYGCQQNYADTEVVRSVLSGSGYHWVNDSLDSDIVLLNTCAIRDNAEKKIWGRLGSLRGLNRKDRKNRTIGLLGCMAERLKSKLLEEEAVDLVVGPDGYRDLPRLLDLVEGGQKAFNVHLSHEETYADIKPVRVDPNNVSAFVSIMRGCNNVCSFCIVPFTRGRERSRPIETIVDEVKRLSDQGVKEVVLLGQNVNSYFVLDRKTTMIKGENRMINGVKGSYYEAAEGFSNIYKSRDGPGPRFVDVLDQVSRIDPEMRIRFTSPHPKDFPPGLLQLIAERPTLCANLHLPAQSGNTEVLHRMRRGYSREAYLALVNLVRETIPGVALSSDFITGFCGETEEEHQDTITLLETVGYDQAFMFAYSLRERTNAAYHLQDDVPPEVKQRRLSEIISTFRRVAKERNQAEVGRRHLVLVEGPSKRSSEMNPTLTGRTDNNKRCVFPNIQVRAQPIHPTPTTSSSTAADSASPLFWLKAGDYVEVEVVEGRHQTLVCEPLTRSSIQEFTLRG